jgi:hypothetical protein
MCDFCVEKELDGSVVEISWAKPADRDIRRQLKRGGYPAVLPRGIGSTAIHNPGFLNMYNGRG